MKRIVITVIMFFILSVTSFATDSFEMSELSSDEIEKNGYVSITPLDEEPQNERILCFDVNENGSYAIGVGEGSVRRVIVYNSVGDYMYAFNFVSEGSFGIEYKGDIVSIYFVRGDLCQEINAECQIVSVKKILDTSENNAYWSHVLYDTERVVGDKTYTLKGKKLLFIPEYAKLTVTDSNGNEEVLYKADDDEKSPELFFVIITIGAFATIFIWGEYRKGKESNKSISKTDTNATS